jgi:hypothetical protein
VKAGGILRLDKVEEKLGTPLRIAWRIELFVVLAFRFGALEV